MVETPNKQEVEMKTHLDVVGLIDLITGIFFTTMGVLVSLGVLLVAPWFNGASLWRPEDAFTVFAVVLGVSGVFLVIGVPSLIAGVGLLKKKSWARIVTIMVAIMALTSFPFGTGAGVYTLWVLTRTESEQPLSPAV
jgi:hypothetical protein